LLAAEGMVVFGIELGVSQQATNGRMFMRLAHHDRQRGAVVPRSLTRPLSRDDLLLHIDHSVTLQPKLPSAPVMVVLSI
jgi:hypothetical protein